MTGKERMLKTLRFEEPDRPPHYEYMLSVYHEFCEGKGGKV